MQKTPNTSPNISPRSGNQLLQQHNNQVSQVPLIQFDLPPSYSEIQSNSHIQHRDTSIEKKESPRKTSPRAYISQMDMNKRVSESPNSVPQILTSSPRSNNSSPRSFTSSSQSTESSPRSEYTSEDLSDLTHSGSFKILESDAQKTKNHQALEISNNDLFMNKILESTTSPIELNNIQDLLSLQYLEENQFITFEELKLRTIIIKNSNDHMLDEALSQYLEANKCPEVYKSNSKNNSATNIYNSEDPIVISVPYGTPVTITINDQPKIITNGHNKTTTNDQIKTKNSSNENTATRSVNIPDGLFTYSLVIIFAFVIMRFLS